MFAVLRRHALLTRADRAAIHPKRLLIASLVRVRGHNLRELSDALTEADHQMGRWAQSRWSPSGAWPSAPSYRIGWSRRCKPAGMDDDTLLTLGRAMQHPAPLVAGEHPENPPRTRWPRCKPAGISAETAAVAVWPAGEGQTSADQDAAVHQRPD